MRRHLQILTITLLSLGGLAGGLYQAIPYWLPKPELPPVSPVLLDHAGEVLCTQVTPDEKWRLPLSLTDIPPLFLKMLIACEDKRFYSHSGVDPLALVRAGWQWMKNRKIISGGSTLTMQTVRLLKPHPRTLLNKISEIFQALCLERFYSKDEILTMYLTLAPYGGNLEGMRAASLAYFQQDPLRLTPAQMALLVAIPQSPTVLRPYIFPEKAKYFRNKVLTRLGRTGILSPQQVRESLSDPVPAFRFPFPAHACHVMNLLRRHFHNQNLYHTTLDLKKQAALEELLRHEIRFFEVHQTSAALIIENATRNVVAYVGSADPYSEPKNGFVDMVQAIRSPGSTLKPFIYALAFEENMIHPETLIKDISTIFKGYMPTNFRDAFHGEVTIREALQQSLNIPVVLLLERLGAGRFTDWLCACNIPLFFPKVHENPGLPIALGGVGMRLYDLAALYCALANQGKFAPLSLVSHSPSIKENPLVSSLASWYVTRILEDAPAPEGFVDWSVTERNPIAFKTGTSYGARDALCMGYTTGPEGYTVGVWTGRPDGTPSFNQLGRKTAAPILLKIFNSILVTPTHFQKTSYLNPPPEALLVSNNLLPAPLRRFRTSSFFKISASGKQDISISRFLSPQTNMTFSLQKKEGTSSFVPIPLIIQGASPPFLFLVNGQPANLDITHEAKDKVSVLWTPHKAGFFELTFIDAQGNSDTVTLRLIS